MKYNNGCIKCKSHDIVIENKKTSISYSNYVTVKKNWSTFIYISRYICVNCGYTEEWVDNMDDLKKIEKKLKKSGPYDEFV